MFKTRHKRPFFLSRLCLVAAGCSLWTGFGCSDGGPSGPARLPLTPEVFTTLQAVWEPLAPSVETRAAMANKEFTVYDHSAFEAAGLGVRLGPGNPWQEHADLAPEFSQGAAESRRSLAYIWQAADPQIIDEESPIRFEAFDMLYRPNGHLSTQSFDAHVQTARRISEQSGRAFDFAVVAGDLSDGSQLNELSWMLSSLNGGLIDPDSGLDDDPVPGPDNDYNDPFTADGLGRPWYAAIGNHDTLYNGGFGQITAELREAAAGEDIFNYDLFPNGYCDGSTLHAELVTEGSTPADERRVPQNRTEVLSLLQSAAGDPAGHGLTAEDVAAGRGYFSVHPIEGKPLRLIVLDTVNSEPQGIGEGSQGWIDAEQFAWLTAELTAADSARELIVVMSHHRPVDFSPRSPTSPDDLHAALIASSGVVLHVTGHGHANVKKLVQPVGEGWGYWQLMLASPLDFPLQSRIIEIVDEANGFLSIYTTNLDHNSPVDSLAHYARGLAAAKLVFGPAAGGQDVDSYWQGELAAQNLILRLAIPAELQASLATHDWPAQIESEQTLANLPPL